MGDNFCTSVLENTDKESKSCRDGDTLFKAKEQDTNDPIFAGDDLVILRRVGSLKYSDLFRKGSNQCLSGCLRLFVNGSFSLRRADNDFSNVEVGNRVAREPIICKKGISIWGNLTNTSDHRRGAPSFERASAVSRYGYRVWSSNRDDGCRLAIANHKQAKPDSQAHYLRFRNLGFSGAWNDQQHSGTIFDLINRDVDISVNGKRWFHLFSPLPLCYFQRGVSSTSPSKRPWTRRESS